MSEYHKIVTVWHRDPENNHKTLMEGSWALPVFEYLKNCAWLFTEKVDGTNIRVMWDGEKVRFGGKTDNAQIPAFLLDKLTDTFPADAMAAVFNGPMTLYGEGYGNKIQKVGKHYIPDGVDFILFDAYASMWIERPMLEDFAAKLDINIVPIVGRGTLAEAVEMTQSGYTSSLADVDAEGIVARPRIEMLTRQGKRIITKVKHKDFR